MSDIMRPIPFAHLMDWALREYREQGSIFGVRKIKSYDSPDALPIFAERIEKPFGPAAGPHTQLAQNIISAYVAGARFFELKTVQIIDGEEMAACVAKPCIASEDECYNCEWSTELTVEDAFAEYVKAWYACKLLSRECGLGKEDGFVFNMSAGYDLEGIQSLKVDIFIECMKDALDTQVWHECRSWALSNLWRFEHVDKNFIDSITPHISTSITESTLHGCPPEEIERIAAYLIADKGLNTYVKCNPTLLGYEFARTCLDSLGFDYISFDEHHFTEDLQWADAVPMFERLQKLAGEHGVEFGVKLTNTFPVEVCEGELPSEEMFMSGRALYPLTIHLARRIAQQFEGRLRISYSGGADVGTVPKLFEAGIWPVTLATAMLKPGGYERLGQIADALGPVGSAPFAGVDVARVAALDDAVAYDPRYQKPLKAAPSHKIPEPLPLVDCFAAGCRDGCPIHQDIPAYLRAVDEGRFLDAFDIIVERNALPFMTGTLCPHTCVDKCMRTYYDEGVRIREYKLRAAEAAFAEALPKMAATSSAGAGRRVAIVGGGPAGLSAAYFLTREGADVTIFERGDALGGAVRQVIPAFRIEGDAIDRDVELCLAFGAHAVLGREITSIAELKDEGFDDVVVATGAWLPGSIRLEEGDELDALEFLAAAKSDPESLDLGTDVVVVGAGNTAMDTARAAKRLPGVENVRIVYRRTKRLMPADEEELNDALEDGVELLELLAPKALRDGVLVCNVVELGEPGADGRRVPVITDKTADVPATAVICAVGERVDTGLLQQAGVAVDERGRLRVSDSGSCDVAGIWIAGDCKRGPATIVEAIADAAAVSTALIGTNFDGHVADNKDPHEDAVLAAKGDICLDCDQSATSRCLGCATICEVCCDVCPNRANVAISAEGFENAQIIHVDGMCNECGNCAVFCPWEGRPYRDKLTAFWSEEDLMASENPGFLKDGDGFVVRLDGEVGHYDVNDEQCGLPDDVRRIIKSAHDTYAYLLEA